MGKRSEKTKLKRKIKTRKKDKDREIKEMEKLGYEYIGTIDDFKIPAWWECVWRRKACEKDECKICGKVKRARQKHIDKGEDPDDMKFILEDMTQDFKNAIKMVRKDAARRGIDISNLDEFEEEEPPAPEDFPLHERVMSWRAFLHEVLVTEELFKGIDMESEAVKDLSWYANTLAAKTYRQLCNQWHIKKGDKYGEFDYKYTKYVLGECFKTLTSSLLEIIACKKRSRSSVDQFLFLREQLALLKISVLNI